jgi:hypothetical protein
MHSQRNCRWARATALEEGDLQLQAALLIHLLIEYPIHLTEAEIIRALVKDSQDFGERDAVERAVSQLAAVGLLHRQEPFVLPSAPAFHAYELWEA